MSNDQVHDNQQQTQTQQRELTEEEILESYYDAQRAGVEAADVGRATLEQTHAQGEQLDRAEKLADETQFSFDKAGRILRGMTWSGWVANMFTPDVLRPDSNSSNNASSSSSNKQPPLVYENRPDQCRGTVQAIQNYHANVKVLQDCETNEQRETCQIICNSMYDAAIAQLESLKDDKSLEAYTLEFDRDLKIIRNLQQKCQQQRSGTSAGGRSSRGVGGSTTSGVDRKQQPQQQNQPPQSKLDVARQRQEQHLDVLSQNLDELGNISTTLGEAIGKQNQTMDRVGDKSDNILEQSKRVTRRTERMITYKSWTNEKPVYVSRVSIRHIDSGKYLAVVNGDLYLVPRYSNSCLFSMWKRSRGNLFGLKSHISGRWLTQNVFGSLACSAYSFGRREEWEADGDNIVLGDDNQSRTTTLLCASAGWGAGGYLKVRQRDWAVLIGKSGVEEKKKAALWCMEEQQDV